MTAGVPPVTAARNTSVGRFGVPHSVDGPKVALGILWFAALAGASAISPLLVIVVVVPVAGAAAYQVARSWARLEPVDPVLAAVVAAVLAGSGAAGITALGVVCVVAAPVVGLHGMVLSSDAHRPRPATRSGGRPGDDLSRRLRPGEVLLTCGGPVGLAAGSLVVLAGNEVQAFVSLLLLVSAYEVGDFLVGTGSNNAYEGPVAGLVAVALVTVGLDFVLPHPFTTATMPVFGALAGVCAVLGQIAASALLPSGSAWAPGLRRLDSYLLAAPLWVLLIR